MTKNQGFNIINSRVVFNYENNFSIRRRIFDFEDSLKGFFKTPFTTIPVPDNYDPSIPRFESDSLHGHTKLQVTPINTSILTNYDQGFESKPEVIKNYLKERVDALKILLSSERHTYLGYIVTLIYEMPLAEINNFLKENSGLHAIREKTIDLSVNYSFPFSERYYLTVKYSKFSALFNNVNNEAIEKYGISVELDVNTKYSLSRGIEFDTEMFSKVADILFGVINTNQLSHYINGSIII